MNRFVAAAGRAHRKLLTLSKEYIGFVLHTCKRKESQGIREAVTQARDKGASSLTGMGKHAMHTRYHLSLCTKFLQQKEISIEERVRRKKTLSGGREDKSRGWPLIDSKVRSGAARRGAARGPRQEVAAMKCCGGNRVAVVTRSGKVWSASCRCNIVPETPSSPFARQSC